MLFNSVAFLLFLPAVVILYYLLPHRYRWILLLGASYFFYGSWKVEFLSLILLSTVVDYSIARLLDSWRGQRARRALVGLSLIVNLGVLFVFKYLQLFLPDVDPMIVNIYTVDFPWKGFLKQAIYFSIPVGISFYTFQTLSYTLDVYHRRVQPEKHLGKFALFVSFFPQLVAGPIERFGRLMPQLNTKQLFDYDNFQTAFRLMLYGFFLKMCIADNLAPLVDQVYDHPDWYSSFTVLLGTIGFGFQIYADFAGYSLIAQGAALLLGIKLMDNFKTPYFSTSIGEFWKRWHISLSTWFRDYLYIPLGGSKQAAWRWAIAIMIVFVVSGFWHGANYTFLIWGTIHGGLYLIERILKPVGVKVPQTARKVLGAILIFILVQLAWVYFRADSVQHAESVLSSLIRSKGTSTLQIPYHVAIVFVVFTLMEIAQYNVRVDAFLGRFKTPIRWILYAAILWCIAVWSGLTNHPFIYFQF